MSNIFKINIRDIALAGLLVAVGVVVDAFVRFNNFTFATQAIYILIALTLPLSLSLSSVMIIDALSLLIRGQIGMWYWAFEIEALSIVLISFIVKMMFTSIKSFRIKVIVVSMILLATLAAASAVIADHVNEFNPSLKTRENSSHRDERMVRWITFSAGALFMSIYITWIITKILMGRMNEVKIRVIFVAIIVSILIDWFINPWAAYSFNVSRGYIVKSSEIYTTYIMLGIIKSPFHIFLSSMLVESIFKVLNNYEGFKKANSWT